MNTKKQRKYQNKPHSNSMRNVNNNNEQKREKRNKILAYILAGFMVLWTIGSVLGAIGFVKSSAEADTTLTRNEVTDDGYTVTFTGMNGAFVTDSQNLVRAVMNDTLSMRFERQAEMLTIFTQSESLSLSIDAVNTAQTRVLPAVVFHENSDYENYNLYLTFNASSWNAFNGVPFRASYQKNAGDSVLIWIDYADQDGNITGTLSIDVSFSAVDWSYVYLPIWQYAIDWTTGMYADEIFTYYDYQENGTYNNGYDAGYLAGKNDGFGAGYNEGAQDAGDYTFMSLISSVVDAPIQAFMGLFNFELLGINLSGFFLSLLTVCVIVAVVKLFI